MLEEPVRQAPPPAVTDKTMTTGKRTTRSAMTASLRRVSGSETPGGGSSQGALEGRLTDRSRPADLRPSPTRPSPESSSLELGRRPPRRDRALPRSAGSAAPWPAGRDQIVAWHQAHVTNGPTEATNNLIKRIKRVAFGFRRFRHYRIRALLYAGRPNWALLATLTPR